MSELSVFITNLETKAKELKANIAPSLANHNSLLGYTKAIQDILAVLSPIVSALIPSTSTEVAAVNTVVNDVESAVSVSEPVTIAS